jgi:hypothetical protein
VINITLTWWECRIANLIAGERTISSRHSGAVPKAGQRQEDTWEDGFEGACGEVAFCKAFNIYWPAKVDAHLKKECDVDPDIEVRTRRWHNWDLIVRPDDDFDRRFVHVTGFCPHYSIRGWLVGWAAQDDAYWKNYGNGREPAWFVPTRHLMRCEDFQVPSTEIYQKKFNLEP